MGIQKQSIIEVNGKRYDARTGQLLTAAAATKSKPVKPSAAPKARTVNDISRKTQRSQTLMRNGVKRPAVSPRVTKVKHRTINDFRAVRQTANKTLLPAKSEADRLVRAAKVKQSDLVRKFGDIINPGSFPTVNSRVESLAVQPAPLEHKPVKLKPSSSVASASGASRLPNRSKTESLIEKGLRNAKAHEEPAPKIKSKAKRKRGRIAAYTGGAMAALLLVGFVAFQNIPKIAVKYASARSGVEASVPSYQPSGFSLSPHVKYNPGQIELNYQSNADDRSYTVVQRDSPWNSDELKSNFVLGASDGLQPQTYEDKGRTIYLYGNGSASWVSQGVWYEIEGDSSQLTSDQLIRIATSL